MRASTQHGAALQPLRVRNALNCRVFPRREIEQKFPFLPSAVPHPTSSSTLSRIRTCFSSIEPIDQLRQLIQSGRRNTNVLHLIRRMTVPLSADGSPRVLTENCCSGPTSAPVPAPRTSLARRDILTEEDPVYVNHELDGTETTHDQSCRRFSLDTVSVGGNFTTWLSLI